MTSRILLFLVFVLIIANADYLFIASGLYIEFPHFFGLSNGLILLLGPLLWFYAKSMLDPEFEFHFLFWVHLIPYLLFAITAIPLWLMPEEQKIKMTDLFISGQLRLRSIDYGIFLIQITHFLFYISKTVVWLRGLKSEKIGTGVRETLDVRIEWIRFLVQCYSIYFILVLTLAVLVFYSGTFSVIANYSYTLFLSLILYVIIYRSFHRPDMIDGGFTTKYQNFDIQSVDKQNYLERVRFVMEDKKLYLQSELKLAHLAKEAGLSAHVLSRLINENYSQSFFDYVNGYRVDEFKRRLSSADSDAMTLYGLALESGFNNKSTFNKAFKKKEGLTPLEYKKSITSEKK